MAIHTQESLSGFIASEPLRTRTSPKATTSWPRATRAPVNCERNGQAIEVEEFIAKKIGHDAARTRYEVDRTPRNSAGRDAAAYESPQRTTAAAQAAPVSM